MIVITMSAEKINARPFVFAENSPALKAVRIIQEMNLNVIRDQGGVLAGMKNRQVEIVPPQTVQESNYLLEILLNGVQIHMDPKLAEATNNQLREENFKNERNLCVIQ